LGASASNPPHATGQFDPGVTSGERAATRRLDGDDDRVSSGLLTWEILRRVARSVEGLSVELGCHAAGGVVLVDFLFGCRVGFDLSRGFLHLLDVDCLLLGS
jgi:hypothetical protein